MGIVTHALSAAGVFNALGWVSFAGLTLAIFVLLAVPAFATEVVVPPGAGLQAAISGAAAGDTIRLQAGEYTTSGAVPIDKDLTIAGAGRDATVVRTTSDTAGSQILDYDTAGWFTVAPTTRLSMSDLTLDGGASEGCGTGAAVYARGPLTAQRIRVTDVRYAARTGIGFALIGAGHSLSACVFERVERVGVYVGAAPSLAFPDLDPSVVHSAEIASCIFTGAGGTALEYGVEVGRGGHALVRGSTFSGYGAGTGDGLWRSAAVMASSLYEPGIAQLTMEDCSISACDTGISIGYPTQDRDTPATIRRTSWNAVVTDLAVVGGQSVVSTPLGSDNVDVDRLFAYVRYDETDTRVTPAPPLPINFLIQRVIYQPLIVYIYRFYNLRNGTHFYTSSSEERDRVIALWPNIYRYEGIGYSYDAKKTSQPLYRFFHLKNGSHFYTASDEERAKVIATWPDVYRYEGPAYNISSVAVPGSITVWRFFNLRNGSHFYTVSETERDYVAATWPNVYRLEGPAFFLPQ